MSFKIEFADRALVEVEEELFWLLGHAPERAPTWESGLESAVQSLSEFPRRCPLAPEEDRFSTEVRQLRYGSHRILFSIVDADDDGEDDTVRILHVRHVARRRLAEAGD